MTHHNWIAAAGFAAAASLPLATLVAPHASAATALVASSSSAALNVNVVVDGGPLSLPNALPAAGAVTTTVTAPYAASAGQLVYSHSATFGKFALSTAATKVLDKATSPTHPATSIYATASSSMASFSTTLTYSGFPVISISGTKLVSNAKSTLTSKGVATSTGTPVSFGSLSVTASALLGLTFINPLPAAGAPVPPNYVLAQDATGLLKIYLNRQIYTGPMLHYTSIKVDAIDVSIAPGYNILGHTVAGDIEVGSTFAN